MKLIFALVLLQLCFVALPAQRYEDEYVYDPYAYGPSGRDGLFDKLKEIVEAIIKQTNNIFNDALAKYQEIKAGIMDKVERLLNEAIKKIQDLVSGIDGKLKDLEAGGVAAKDCVKEYAPKVKEIAAEAKLNTMRCAQKAKEYVESVEADIKEQWEGVTKQFGTLFEIFQECFSPINPIKTTTCFLGESKDIRDSITNVLSNIWNAVTSIATNSAAMVVDATKCMAATTSAANSQLLELLRDVKTCIAESKL